ncbi:MAG: hypothetical protein ACPGVO_16345 [Spirulinaceae cyanobacterium]
MKRTVRWFIGVIALTAAVLITAQGWLTGWHVFAQTPSPTPAASPSPAVSPAPSPAPSPAASPVPNPAVSPSPSPSPAASPSPSPTPTASPSPTPEASPVPNPAAAPEPATAPALPMGEPYRDPGDRFEVGLIEGYSESMVAGIPLFESETGDVAYTVAIRPRANSATVNEAALAQIAIDLLGNGEGFKPGVFELAPNGSAKLPWSGSLTTKGPPQTMQGLVLSRQADDRILILTIAATEAGSDSLESVYSSLEPTLLVPTPDAPEPAAVETPPEQ